jgi:serine/threonine protein kinase
LERRYSGKLSPDALKLLKGTLALDPTKRFTALECLACSWFDDLREPEVDRLIEAEQQRKQQQLQIENLSALNSYQNQQRDMRRGESSKSRASVRSTNQYASSNPQHQNHGHHGQEPTYTMQNTKNTIYNSKYNLH